MAVEQYPELMKTLIQIGKHNKTEYKANLQAKNKVASGKLYNSIDYRIELTDKGCKLYFVAEKYYINIENGRKAGAKMPPVELIKRWMDIKGIKPRKGYSLSGTAFIISRSISKKGIKPNPFLREIKKGLKEYVDDIKIAVAKDLNKDIKVLTTKLKQVKGNKYIQFKKK